MTGAQMLFTILCATAIALAFIAIVYKAVGGTTPRIHLPEPTTEEHYGHPKPPVATLRRALPAAPQNHAWEIYTQVSHGTPRLHLKLIRLTASGPQQVAETSEDLLRYRWHNTTWSEFYGNYPSLGKDEFNKRIIRSLVGWAETQRYEITNSTQPTDYHLDI